MGDDPKAGLSLTGHNAHLFGVGSVGHHGHVGDGAQSAIGTHVDGEVAQRVKTVYLDVCRKHVVFIGTRTSGNAHLRGRVLHFLLCENGIVESVADFTARHEFMVAVPHKITVRVKQQFALVIAHRGHALESDHIALNERRFTSTPINPHAFATAKPVAINLCVDGTKHQNQIHQQQAAHHESFVN